METFGILENWWPTKDGLLREVVATGGSTAFSNGSNVKDKFTIRKLIKKRQNADLVSTRKTQL